MRVEIIKEYEIYAVPATPRERGRKLLVVLHVGFRNTLEGSNILSFPRISSNIELVM